MREIANANMEAFLQERCEFHPDAQVYSAQLRKAYTAWSRTKKRVRRIPARVVMSDILIDHGCVREVSASTHAALWHGVRLVDRPTASERLFRERSEKSLVRFLGLSTKNDRPSKD